MGDGQHEKVNVPGKSMGYSSYESIHEEFGFFPSIRRMYETKCSSSYQLCKYFFRNFLQVSNSYLHLIRLRTNDSIYNDVIRYSLVETYYCRDKVYPARCLFLKYVRYNRHQNMATPAMAIKAAIAKAAFAILPFSIETELRLKYFMYTILIEV